MIRDFQATSAQRFVSAVRFMMPEIAAGIALVALLVLLPVVAVLVL